MSTGPIAKPKCPECKVEGIENIEQEESSIRNKVDDPWFNVAFCKQCGHVYGVFAKIVHPPSRPSARF